MQNIIDCPMQETLKRNKVWKFYIWLLDLYLRE